MAADLLSQAEHDEDAQAILLSDDADFLDAVEQSIDKLLPEPCLLISVEFRISLY